MEEWLPQLHKIPKVQLPLVLQLGFVECILFQLLFDKRLDFIFYGKAVLLLEGYYVDEIFVGQDLYVFRGVFRKDV